MLSVSLPRWHNTDNQGLPSRYKTLEKHGLTQIVFVHLRSYNTDNRGLSSRYNNHGRAVESLELSTAEGEPSSAPDASANFTSHRQGERAVESATIPAP